MPAAQRPTWVCGTVPADVVLLVGVLGNISDRDVAATVAAMPRLCASGATLLWSRGRSLEGADDFVTPVRRGVLRRRVRRGVYPFLRRRGRPHRARRCSLLRTAGAARCRSGGERWFTFVG